VLYHLSMIDTYVAALMGMERTGVGELVTMPLPEDGKPPERLYRPFEKDGRAMVTVYEQWGDPDHNIYSYVLVGVEPDERDLST